MSELRRMLLANAIEQASNTGGDLPTNIVASSVPNEDNARIYEYLKSLRVEQTAIPRSITYDGDIIAIYGTQGEGYALYSDGRCNSSSSGD